MSKKIVAFSCIAWALAAVLGANPANAYLAVRESDLNHGDATRVEFTGIYEAVYNTPICGFFDDEGHRNFLYAFDYEQRMTIGAGPSVMALVDHVYNPGREDLYLIAACDGWLIYGAGSCVC